MDIPLLIENKINKKNDILVFVDAKKKEINKKEKKVRLTKSKSRSPEEDDKDTQKKKRVKK